MEGNGQSAQAPHPSRHTSRLTMRPLADQDLDFLTELFSRRELVAHRPDPRPDTPAECAARLARDISRWRQHGFGRWTVLAGETPIGFAGVTVSERFGGLNLSYHLHPDCWGRGYATELVCDLLDFAFDDLSAQRIVGLVRSENPASRRVLEKCGFIFERQVMLHGAPTNLYAAKR